LPTVIQVVLAMRVLAMADEFGEEGHTATNRVRGPSGEAISEVGGPYLVEGEPGYQDWLQGIIVTTVIQFEVSQEGTYMIEQEVDASTESLPIHIVHGPSPGTEWPDEEEPPANDGAQDAA
jgi:hypothetical protein